MWDGSMRKCLELMLVALAIGMPAPALAACDIRLGPIRSSPIAYDPFELGSADGLVSLSADLVDGDDCEAVIALTDQSGAPLRAFRFTAGDRSVTLRGELRETSNVRTSGSPDSVRVRLSRAAPHADLVWRLLSSEDAVLPPGDATLDIVATSALALGSTNSSRGTLILRSLPRAQANLAGAAGSFASGNQAQTIDFGALATGAQRQVFLQVRANVPAHLSFTSAHGGFLASEADARIRVPYAISFDGQPLQLASIDRRDVAPPLTINGAAFPIVVTIGDVRGAIAGRYSDTVSIEISP